MTKSFLDHPPFDPSFNLPPNTLMGLNDDKNMAGYDPAITPTVKVVMNIKMIVCVLKIKFPEIFLDVKALNSAPIESNSAESILVFGLFLVPLKNMCSKKCESPFCFLVSYLEPVPTTTRTVAVLVPRMGAVITRIPFFSFVCLNIKKKTDNRRQTTGT